ncbi:YwqJ-related putative deaminase [Streptomyces sp. NPDC018045]|uniref:YwqJ-related putative deaminase n=1 Tax=Streptomyces sp. NPDC018045 TaxID=3365037 RepID=UPI00379CE054
MSDLVPGTASSLLVQGRIFSHTNLSGAGEPNLHPAVREFLEALPVEFQDSFTGYCAESALISDQMWGIDAERPGRAPISLDEALPHFAGAAMVSKMIREEGDPDHGQPTAPCAACRALIDRLGIDFVGA